MRIKRGVITVCVLVIGSWLVWTFSSGDSDAETPTRLEENSSADASIVELSEQKFRAAEISVTAVVPRTLRAIETVPGRLRYDEAGHIAVTASSNATMIEVCVKPGDVVEAGQLLAVISSPEIGNARADVLRHRNTVGVTRTKQEWQEAVCDGLERLVQAVEEDENVTAILADLDDVTLGAYRSDVLTACTRYQLARRIADNTENVAESGAIPFRVVDERMSERDAAEAELSAVTEQSLFDAKQSSAITALEASDASQRLHIAEQHLETLLGYPDPLTPSSLPEPLSLVEIRAPLAGTVESRAYSKTERTKNGDELFVIADTSVLWVSADIREREWPALQLEPGQTIEVVVPALDDNVLTATLHYVGRQVLPATNAVPLIGTLPNTDGLLRPGQFVRVRLSVGPARNVLAVPGSAIVAHEGETFVFVQEGDATFRRVDVRTGLEESADDEWTEITSGLNEGDQVVIHGAFVLKSELLLEREE